MTSQRTDSPRFDFKRLMTPALVAGSAALLLAVKFGHVELDFTEAVGFVTGGLTVWLLVSQNIWNWPIGIANNLVYGLIFFQARLYADMTIQIVFALISVYGWISWLRGNTTRGGFPVTRTPLGLALACLAIGVAGTWAWSLFLARINDSAPLLDALTAVMSLIAQYLMTRKYLENWTIWIVVDIISVGLYASRHLYLTAVLYAIYIAMCTVGAIEWRRSMRAARV
jgi:nicotinamide mononucleotide transporter